MLTDEEIQKYYPKAFTLVKNLERNKDEQSWQSTRDCINNYGKGGFEEYLSGFFASCRSLCESEDMRDLLKEVESEDLLKYIKVKLGML